MQIARSSGSFRPTSSPRPIQVGIDPVGLTGSDFKRLPFCTIGQGLAFDVGAGQAATRHRSQPPSDPLPGGPEMPSRHRKSTPTPSPGAASNVEVKVTVIVSTDGSAAPTTELSGRE